ncbi:hypothetical protein N7478_002042 [Penicillium angulare]|uniref:uncharacterized protein n=1 Tax=Penicillium angulare TaxID=116970 RepID=UPI00253FF5B5|nr:uncharacterized protein N7478_002042 [Penicillium angulare]KAJ5289012.1 hypothetical protein N7478_002042 [Penicillium angulare]
MKRALKFKYIYREVTITNVKRLVDQGSQNQPADYNIKTEDIKLDLTAGKGRPEWVFSAYAPLRDLPRQLFGGPQREQSMEEMRLRHYQLTAAGNMDQAVQEAQALWTESVSQMDVALNDLNGAVKYIVDGANEHPNRIEIVAGNTGANTNQSPAPAQSAFGQPSQSQSSNAFGSASSGWGKPAAPSQPSGFGQPSALGQTSAFGQPSTLGQPSGQASGFGQPSALGQTSAFGQPSNVGAQSGFGKPAFGQSGSGFGQAANNQPAFGQTAFGQTSAPAAPFGGAAASASPFGGLNQQSANPSPFTTNQPAAPANGSPFGQVGSQQPAAAPSGFGQPSAQQPDAAPSGFGQPSTGAFGQPSQTTTPFGQPQQQPAQPNPFGQPSAPAVANPFGAPQQPAASFGQAAAQQAAAPQDVRADLGPPALMQIDDPNELNPLPRLQGETRRDPMSNRLVLWKGQRVQYVDNEYPCYIHPQDNKTLVRINFPDGPPFLATLRDSQGKEQEYTPEVEEMYQFFLNNGYFKDGIIPAVPPKKEWVSFDF